MKFRYKISDTCEQRGVEVYSMYYKLNTLIPSKFKSISIVMQ